MIQEIKGHRSLRKFPGTPAGCRWTPGHPGGFQNFYVIFSYVCLVCFFSDVFRRKTRREKHINESSCVSPSGCARQAVGRALKWSPERGGSMRKVRYNLFCGSEDLLTKGSIEPSRGTNGGSIEPLEAI